MRLSKEPSGVKRDTTCTFPQCENGFIHSEATLCPKCNDATTLIDGNAGYRLLGAGEHCKAGDEVYRGLSWVNLEDWEGCLATKNGVPVRRKG